MCKPMSDEMLETLSNGEPCKGSTWGLLSVKDPESGMTCSFGRGVILATIKADRARIAELEGGRDRATILFLEYCENNECSCHTRDFQDPCPRCQLKHWLKYHALRESTRGAE